MDVSAFQLVSAGTGKFIGVIGTCTGGKPREIIEFDNMLDALATLRTGPMVEEVVRMYSPGPGVVGGPVVKAYRINNAVQATLTHDSKLTLTAKDYGKWTNDIRLSVANGTDSGKKVTLDALKASVSETRDNLGNAMNMQYLGAGSAAALTVGKLLPPAAPTVALATGVGALAAGANYVALAYLNEFGEEGLPSVASALITTAATDLGVTVTIPATAAPGVATIAIYWGTTSTVANMKRVTAVALGTVTYAIIATPSGGAAVNPQTSNQSRSMLRTRITGGATGEDLDFDLASSGLDTLIELVEVLNGLSTYTADLLSQDPDVPSTYLDDVVAGDIKTSELILTDTLGSIIYWANAYSNLVTIVRVTNATAAPANTTVPSSLTGGSEGGALTISDWIGAFDAFMATEVNYIFPVSTDPAVHFVGRVHVYAASSMQERKYRILFVGGGTSLDNASVTEAKRALAGSRVVYAYPGITRRNLFSGNVENLSGMSLAAVLAGLTGSYPVGEPITNKPMSIDGMQKEFTTSEMITLSQEGLCIPRKREDSGDFVVLRDATTWTADANTVLRRISGIECVDELSRRLITGLRPFIGQKGNILTIAAIQGAVRAILDAATVTPTNPDGILTTGRMADATVIPAYENLMVAYDGQVVVGVTVDVRLVGEIELITVDARALPATIVLI